MRPEHPYVPCRTTNQLVCTHRRCQELDWHEFGRREHPTWCDCGHPIGFHHDERGCGYFGFGVDWRCRCLLTTEQAISALLERAQAEEPE